jgi:hypothetical protein
MPRGAEMGFSLGLGIAHGILIVSFCELPNSMNIGTIYVPLYV